MTNTKLTWKLFTAKKPYLSLREHLSIPLFVNAYALIANQVFAAGLGILYWTIAARLYRVDVVGENSALISTIIFLSMLSELSLKGAMTRFIPRAGKNTARMILYTYLLTIGLGLAVGVFMLTVGRHIDIIASLLRGVALPSFWLIIFSIFWTIFYVQDGILTGMRQAKWVLFKNALLSITKIFLLIVLLRSFSNYGLAISWFLPVPMLVVLFGALIFWRFMPSHIAQDVSQTKPISRGEIFRSTAGDHVGSILAEASIRMLPLIVLYFLGKEATAYFNQAWIIASTFQAIATNMASSFIVEASTNMQQISMNSRRILRQMFLLIAPAVLVMWVGAPFVLYIFGKNYSEQSFIVLRWLVLATIPYMFIAWYLGYARVLSKVGDIILIQGSQLALTLAAGYYLLPRFEIAGIGLAWLTAETVVAAVILLKAIPILWPRITSQNQKSELSRNQVLRRVDWRFLIPTRRFEKSLFLSHNPHMQSALEAVSRQCLDSDSPLLHDCDVAVAINPNQETLLSAYQATGSDGTLYTEWIAWRVGAMKSIRSRLEGAGFKSIRFYWPLPNPAEPKFWVPLNFSRVPLQYLSQSLFPGNGWISRLLRLILAAVLGVMLHLGMVPHLAVVARKRSTHPADIFDVIRATYKELNPLTSTEHVSFLVKSGGKQINSKIIIFVFNDCAAVSPIWVIKIPRLPEDTDTLAQEKKILTAMRNFIHEKEVPFYIPRFLYNQAVNGVDFYAQTAVSGKPFSYVLNSTDFADVAARLTDIQVALAEKNMCRSSRTVSRENAERLMEEWNCLSTEEMDPSEVMQIREIIAALPPLPEVCVHNDFTPWNILETQAGAAIIDWSDASQKGLPLMDLAYGLANAAFQMSNARQPAAMQRIYRQLVEPNTSVGKVFQTCLDSYAQRIGLPPECIGPLRVLTWVRHTLYELENHRLEHGNDEKLVSSVCIPFLRLELKFQSCLVHDE